MACKLYFERERRDMAVLIYFLHSRFHKQVPAKRNGRVYFLRDLLQDIVVSRTYSHGSLTTCRDASTGIPHVNYFVHLLKIL